MLRMSDKTPIVNGEGNVSIETKSAIFHIVMKNSTLG